MGQGWGWVRKGQWGEMGAICNTVNNKIKKKLKDHYKLEVRTSYLEKNTQKLLN